MNLADLDRFVARRWDEELLPQLIDYVRVPAKSPAFDASWEAHGHLKAVIQAAEQWCRAQPIAPATSSRTTKVAYARVSTSSPSLGPYPAACQL